VRKLSATPGFTVRYCATIQIGYVQGFSLRRITSLINRPSSTISRQLRSN